ALRLLYKDSLIEMRASSRRSEGGKRFDEQTGDIAKAFWQDDRTGLDMSSVFTLNRLNPLFFYTLEGGGAAYNMTYQNGRFCLHEKEGAALQQISDDMQLTESPCD